VLSLSALPAHAAVLLSESFTPPGNDCIGDLTTFPAGWTRHNVDNRTPNANVSYVNQAWTVREDFGDITSNCVPFSTSWYTPAGAANDFMCTPAVALTAQTVLTWRARAYDVAYPDGYEVRVMRAAPTGGTGVIGNMITGSTVVFSIAADSASWANHSVDLDALGFVNEPVYTCFRNNSSDKYLLVVDDVSIIAESIDIAISTTTPPPSPYTRVPANLGITMTPRAIVSNVGTQAVTNISVDAEPLHEGVLDGVVASSPLLPTLATGATATLTASPGRVLDAQGEWTHRYTATMAETDATPANNTLTSSAITVGPDELARDNGLAIGTLGIGAGNGGELGQDFEIPTVAALSAIRFSLGAMSKNDDPQYEGSPLDVNIREFDTATAKPGAVIATTVSTTISITDPHTYTLPIAGGPLVLAPGRYVVTVLEATVDGTGQPGGPTMVLQQTNTVFEPGHTWINWPTNPFGNWANAEDFGAGFAKPFRVSMIFGDLPDGLFSHGFEDVPPASAPASTVTRQRTDGVPQRRLIDAPLH
jgi:hypothetical protein